MKQFVVATLFLAGLLAPAIGTAQGMQCVVVCNPPRVYCVPAGSPLPPIYTMCKSANRMEVGEDSLSASAGQSASTEPACTAQQVFNEETQSYEWRMSCD